MPSFVLLSVDFLPIPTALAGSGIRGVNASGGFLAAKLLRFPPAAKHREFAGLGLHWGTHWRYQTRAWQRES